MLIILHSQHEEASRRFVERFGERHEVIPYPECVDRFPWIRAFPSVILDVPEHSVPEGWFWPEQKAYNIPTHEEILDTPAEMAVIEEVQAFIEAWVKASPAVVGNIYIWVQGEKKERDAEI